jgi:hypothetical protein
MFNNTVNLYPSAEADTDVKVVSLNDTDDGRSVRKINLGGGEFIVLTIGNSESTENKPIINDRHLVRVDHIKPDVSGKPVTASCYIVVTYPRSGFTHTEMYALASMLIRFLANGNVMPDGALPTVFTRLFDGEL